MYMRYMEYMKYIYICDKYIYMVVVVARQLPPAMRPKEALPSVPRRTGSLRQGRKRSGREQRKDATCEYTNVYSNKSGLQGRHKTEVGYEKVEVSNKHRGRQYARLFANLAPFGARRQLGGTWAQR